MKEYKAAIYLRLSRENTDDNNSIEAQREIITKYAKQNSYKIIKEYVDNGYSGILNSRPALNKMMIDIARGYINMVIVKDISRLTRDKNKTGWYTEIFFPDNNVRFISVTEFIDTGERYEIDDTIMLRGIANQYYLTDISKKVRSNKRAMKEELKYVEHNVPYGYKLDEEDKHKIIIDHKVSKHIIEIFDMYIKQNTGTQIANYLNNKRIENPSRYLKMKNASNKWNAETVNKILSNPFYIGNTIMNKYITDYRKKTCKENKDKNTWIIKENTHEAIISKEKYNKVQEIKNKKRFKKEKKNEYLLKDLLYCGHCKHKAQYKNGFICNIVYKKPHICKNKNFINEKTLNQIIITKVMQELNSIETKKIINNLKSKSKSMQELEEHKNELQKLERKKNILYKKRCEKYITECEFKEQYISIKKQITKYQEEILKLEKNNIDKDEKRMEEIIKNFQNGNYINNEFLKQIINRIEMYSNNQIDITFKFNL